MIVFLIQVTPVQRPLIAPPSHHLSPLQSPSPSPLHPPRRSLSEAPPPLSHISRGQCPFLELSHLDQKCTV